MVVGKHSMVSANFVEMTLLNRIGKLYYGQVTMLMYIGAIK